MFEWEHTTRITEQRNEECGRFWNRVAHTGPSSLFRTAAAVVWLLSIFQSRRGKRDKPEDVASTCPVSVKTHLQTHFATFSTWRRRRRRKRRKRRRNLRPHKRPLKKPRSFFNSLAWRKKRERERRKYESRHYALFPGKFLVDHLILFLR